MSGYIGNIPTPQATQTRDTFTATSGQTSFATSGYTPGFLDVYLNGVHLVNGTDYTASNGSDVVLTTGATTGDNLEVVAYTTFQVVDQSFSGNFSVDSPTFVVDAANNRVGVGIAAPGRTLDVAGIARVTGGSIEFAGDTSTPAAAAAIHRPADNTLAFATANTERARIDASGNVGIGTASPSAGAIGGKVIHVQSSGATASIRVDRSDASTAGTLSMTSGNSTNGLFGTGAKPIAFSTDSTERVRIDASGNVGIGTSSPAARATIKTASNEEDALLIEQSDGTDVGSLRINNGSFILKGKSASQPVQIQTFDGNEDIEIDPDGFIKFETAGSERMRINAAGDVGIDQTSPIYSLHIADAGYTATDASAGFSADRAGTVLWQTSTSTQGRINDSSAAAGTHNYLVFYYRGSSIGDIDTTNNSTIRYNTFTGAHWSQMHGSSDLLHGTVMSTIDELVEWTTFEFTNAEGRTEKTTMAGKDYVVGQTYTVAIDEDGATAEGTATGYDTASRLMRVKVSDVEGDPAVYGVFAGAYADGDISVEALGAGVIRIGQGVTVQRGDLLMSAGDGTAKPQDDDIVRSKTIAKCTGNVVLETFDDGSYLVACVLMAG